MSRLNPLRCTMDSFVKNGWFFQSRNCAMENNIQNDLNSGSPTNFPPRRTGTKLKKNTTSGDLMLLSIASMLEWVHKLGWTCSKHLKWCSKITVNWHKHGASFSFSIPVTISPRSFCLNFVYLRWGWSKESLGPHCHCCLSWQ